MKRPLLVAIIGYIFGIWWGLYFKWNIAPFYIFLTIIFLLFQNIYLNNIAFFSHFFRKIVFLKSKNKFKFVSIRYFRYVKLILKLKVIIVFVVFSIISNFIIIYENNKYNDFYTRQGESQIKGVIESNKEEKEFYNRYILKIIEIDKSYKDKNKKIYIYVKKEKKLEIEFGDTVFLKGNFTKIEEQRNYGGFNYKEYLKSEKIYGVFKSEKTEILFKLKSPTISSNINTIFLSIKNKIKEAVNDEYVPMLQGILLGDISEIEENIKENFKIANISHILAISGMHISYIILGIQIALNNILGKRKTKFCVILILILYMCITGFSPSIVRATIMGCLVLFSGILYRKSDIWNSISLSLLIILIYNPFLIKNIGLQFSYLGTIGIIIFYPNINKILKNIKFNNKNIKLKINKEVLFFIDKLKEILAITLSAQIFILPIMIYNFNIFGVYFFIANIFVSLIIGPIIILGFICIICSYIYMPISKGLIVLLELGIEFLILISKISELPFSKKYIATPNVGVLIIYFIIINILNYLYSIYNLNNAENLTTYKRIRNLIALAKFRYNEKRKIYKLILFICVFFILIFKFLPRDLNVNFVDVGQGDCTFIITPMNQTILIDGGGSLSENVDIAKNTVIPYLLDRGYTRVNYIFISHFDQDHVGGILTILEELKVDKIIITKQEKTSQNYEKFLEIVKKKKLKVKVVKKGDIMQIEKNLKFEILWPEKQQIQENILNNNAMVCKLKYTNFSMLFTGDIEKIAEEKIVRIYEQSGELLQLKANILKVAHHGSKTSSVESFIVASNPEKCIIGVGVNNTFGHPNAEVLDRLKNQKIELYRTDINGEITIKIDRKGRYKIETMIR